MAFKVKQKIIFCNLFKKTNMSCNPKTSQQGSDGKCYKKCPPGYRPINNGPTCAKKCPGGFIESDVNVSVCIKPAAPREMKPFLGCPQGADRMYDKCLLGCPVGTTKKFSLCVPNCPPGFVESKDGLSCQAEFVKRVVTIREACFNNEVRVDGKFCMSPCEYGTVPFIDNSELCYATVPTSLQQYFWSGDPKFVTGISPQISKIIFSRTIGPSTCATNFEPLNGQCFADCPINSKPVGTECLVDCPSGFQTTTNQSACLRPLITRAQVVGLGQEIEDLALKIALAVVSVILGCLIFSRIFARKANNTASS